MFLGDERVSTLSAYILGYTQARVDLGESEYSDSEKYILEGFTYWLVLKLRNKLSLGWAGYIEYCIDGSENNIYTFFKLFDEYRNFIEMKSFEGLKQEYNDFVTSEFD